MEQQRLKITARSYGFLLCLLVVLFLVSEVGPFSQTHIIGRKRQGHLDNVTNVTCDGPTMANLTDEEKCNFVLTVCKPITSMAMFNYMAIPYCSLPSAKWFGYALLVALVLFYFFMLGYVADRFFIQSVLSLAKYLRMPPTIAGVVLLGLGGGAPDIITVYSQVKNGVFAQTFGFVIGACMLVGVFMVGAVTLVRETSIKRMPFLIDIAAFILAVCAIVLVFHDRTVAMWEAILWIILYFVYILVVIIGRVVYVRRKKYLAKKFLMREQRNLVSLAMHLEITPNLQEIFDQDPSDVLAFEQEEKLKQLMVIVEALMESSFGDDDANTLPPPEVSEEMEKRQKVMDALFSQMSPSSISATKYFEPRNGTIQTLGERLRNIRDSLDTDVRLLTEDDSYLPNVVDTEDEDGDSLLLGGGDSFSNIPEPDVSDWVQLDDGGQLTLNLGKKKVSSRIRRAGGNLILELKEYLEWPETTVAKILAIVMSPITLLCHSVIHWAEEGKYMKGFYVLHPPCLLVAVFFFFELWEKRVVIEGKDMSLLIVWLFPVSLICSVIVFFTTNRRKPPGHFYNFIFVLEGLVASFLFIEFLADELVQILLELGIIWNINDGIMGLTVLAWGNSIPEIIGNILLAHKGFPEMALSACYSGCISNVLVGLGVSFTVQIAYHGPIYLHIHTDLPDLTNMAFFGLFYILFALFFTLIAVAVSGFRYNKITSYGLVIIYVIFLVVGGLFLFNVLGKDMYFWSVW